MNHALVRSLTPSFCNSCMHIQLLFAFIEWNEMSFTPGFQMIHHIHDLLLLGNLKVVTASIGNSIPLLLLHYVLPLLAPVNACLEICHFQGLLNPLSPDPNCWDKFIFMDAIYVGSSKNVSFPKWDPGFVSQSYMSCPKSGLSFSRKNYDFSCLGCREECPQNLWSTL